MFSALFMVPIFLQQVLGLSPMQAGLVIVPALIVSGLSGVATGRLTDLLPPPVVIMTMMLAGSVIFYAFSSVTTLTAVGVVFYVMLYRICIMGTHTPITVVTVQMLEADQVRMGQGLLGVVRSIGGILGVTITSVLFEQRRAAHQLASYHAYDSASLAHGDVLQALKHFIYQAGIDGPVADRAALNAIRQQMDLEAITAGFQIGFFYACICFLIGCVPMFYLFLRQRPQAIH